LKGGILDPLGTQILCESVTNDFDRIAFIPAVGIALSDRINTPNLLFSHKDRVREALFNRVNLGVFACFIIAVAISFTLFLFKRSTVVKENSNLISLEEQYQQYKPRLSKELIVAMLTKIEKKQEVTNEYSERYHLVGIINELTALTPKEVRIVKINAMLGGIGVGLRGGKNGSDRKAINIVDRGKDIRLEGFVHGEHFRLKTDLFDYVTKLRESTMFDQVRIQESKFASSKKDTVLYGCVQTFTRFLIKLLAGCLLFVGTKCFVLQ
ncbi:MAG: hypothetical protein HQ522_06005, partial [Bacteroidetes bacterium]|nr:hypothetical protein [Bacteroidota bacterium]